MQEMGLQVIVNNTAFASQLEVKQIKTSWRSCKYIHASEHIV